MTDFSQNRRLGQGTWLTIGSPVIAELAAECGFDWLLLDLEHGCATDSALMACLQAAKKDSVKLIVRVPAPDPVIIARVLDWGATGIMVPHISSAAEAEACVRAMRYPPQGERGFSSSVRVFRFGLGVPAELSQWSPPLFLAQIENVKGVMQCEEIAAVEGVDMLFVGPADLRLALSAEPATGIEFRAALARVSAAAARFGKQAGILVRNPADLPELRAAGFTCLALGSDLSFLREGFLDVVGL